MITINQSEFYNDTQFPNYDDLDDFASLIDKASKSIFAKKLDQEIPFGSNILEAGCGTGQMSIFLSRFMRTIYSIDISKGSLITANNFIKKNNLKNINLFRMNIFKLFFQKNYFDVIISNGVLHHTRNAELAFCELVKFLKKDGLIIIGLYHKYGRFIHNIRQKIINIFIPASKFLSTLPIIGSSYVLIFVLALLGELFIVNRLSINIDEDDNKKCKPKGFDMLINYFSSKTFFECVIITVILSILFFYL